MAIMEMKTVLAYARLAIYYSTLDAFDIDHLLRTSSLNPPTKGNLLNLLLGSQ